MDRGAAPQIIALTGFAVVKGTGGERRAGAFGVGAEDQPFTSESPIDLYSVAKPMTAVLAAQLAVDGDIDVDANDARARSAGDVGILEE